MHQSAKSKRGEIPQEVAEQIQQKTRGRTVIREEDVADLDQYDICNRPYRHLKRFLDIVIACCALIVLLIPGAVVALLIYIDDPGKVFFRQYRVGVGGERFRLYKFRTMKLDTPKYLSTSEVNDPKQYITRIGGILRKTSIDELPQIFNILRGDMSVVGPRPLISDEVAIHEMRTKFGVYQLRPGLTGLAQINGRDTVTPADKVHWDVQYLKNYGLKTDVRIFLQTIPKIFGANGVVEGYDSYHAKKKK